MIRIDETQCEFELHLAASQYVMRVDDQGRLEHIHWGPTPDGGAPRELADRSAFLSGDVGWENQTRRWELVAFGDVSYHEVTLKAEFDPPASAAPVCGDTRRVRDLRLRYKGYSRNDDAAPGFAPTHGQPTRNTSPRETLCIHMHDELAGLNADLYYRLTPEHNILERWVVLSNNGTQTVSFSQVGPATWHLPHGTNELTCVRGAWCREFTTHRRPLEDGVYTLESRGMITGAFANPFFLLNRPGQASEDHGQVWFGMQAYSGSWRMAVECLPSSAVRVHGGYQPVDYRLDLAPGESHATPAFIAGCTSRGWGGASRALHRFHDERVAPRAQAQPPHRPVVYNSWYATYFDLNAEHQMALAQKAASIGVEMFCLDDGWFGARRSPKAGLGDWWVSPQVFPEGLKPLVDEVRRLGMKFGLWVEPEMVNPDSDLYRAHPDWVLHYPGRPRTEARNQLVLDLGRPEVVAHLYRTIDAVVREHNVDFLKWDMNRYPTEAGSVAGPAIWTEHVRSVYGLIDRLRQAHPGLSIESCAGGGGRIDAGILARTDQVWTSDNVDPFDRIRIQDGYSLAYPARCMAAWVTGESADADLIRQKFDVASRGVLGIGSDLDALDPAQLEQFRQHIAFYKQVRHIVHDGDLYRLERVEEAGTSVWQFVLPDGSESVYSVAVHDELHGRTRAPRPLRGLDLGASYRISSSDGEELGTRAGYDLATRGICGQPKEYRGYSTTLHLVRTGSP